MTLRFKTKLIPKPNLPITRKFKKNIKKQKFATNVKFANYAQI